jgi:GntR family transcriptional regulator/MocR family aminotransferase
VALASYLARVRGVRVDPANLVICSGYTEALRLLAETFAEVGVTTAGMEDPTIADHVRAVTPYLKVVDIPLDDDGLRVDVLRRSGAEVVTCTPAHQFPIGMTMSPERRSAVLDWVDETRGWIVEDDYDGEYRFGGKPVASLQGLDTDGRVIYAGTFSKVMFPALRLGYLILPKDLVPAFCAVRDALDTCPASLPQRALTDFIREGHFARHIRRMRVLYALRREALVDAIENHLPGRLQVVGAEAGMQLTCLLPDDVDDVALSHRAGEAGVSIRPLSLCYRGTEQRRGVILGYGGVDAAAIDEGVRRLKRCL